MGESLGVLVIVMIVCLFVEQVMCYFPGSIPYRFGFTVYIKTMPTVSKDKWRLLERATGKLSIYVREDEVFLKPRYPSCTIGPCLFVATVKNSDKCDMIKIKVCPVVAIFLAIMLLTSFVSTWATMFDVKSVVMFVANALFVAGAVCIFYYMFMSRLSKLFNDVVV